jgi:hypothetical protein
MADTKVRLATGAENWRANWRAAARERVLEAILLRILENKVRGSSMFLYVSCDESNFVGGKLGNEFLIRSRFALGIAWLARISIGPALTVISRGMGFDKAVSFGATDHWQDKSRAKCCEAPPNCFRSAARSAVCGFGFIKYSTERGDSPRADMEDGSIILEAFAMAERISGSADTTMIPKHGLEL